MRKMLIVYGSDINEGLLVGGLRRITGEAELQVRFDYPSDFAEAAEIDRQVLASAGQYSSVWFFGQSMPTSAGGLRQQSALPVFRVHRGFGATDIDCDWYGDNSQVAVAGYVAVTDEVVTRHECMCAVFQAVVAWLSSGDTVVLTGVDLHTVNRGKLPTLVAR